MLFPKISSRKEEYFVKTISRSANPIEEYSKSLHHGLARQGYPGVNSMSFNCDELTNIHNGKHILFSGCSNTYGVGLEKEETWAYLTYLKLNNIEKCSGFFNIASPGYSIINIVIDIFRYCNDYGNPDVIFINLPDQIRTIEFMQVSDMKGGFKPGIGLKHGDESIINETKFLNYNLYSMLESFCKASNISLYSFSWDNWEGKDSENNTGILFENLKLETFHNLKYFEMADRLFEYSKINKDPYFERARDGSHFGTGYHFVWSDFIFDRYLNDRKH